MREDEEDKQRRKGEKETEKEVACEFGSATLCTFVRWPKRALVVATLSLEAVLVQANLQKLQWAHVKVHRFETCG